MKRFFQELDAIIADGWDIIKKGQFWNYCMNNKVPLDLYQLVMLQIYHYTKYNSINQAATVACIEPGNIALLKFVYKHAQEELGHEGMIIHDLKSISAMPEEIVDPLPPTQALIAYLNNVAVRLGPIPRLGYSYWAEDSYDHIQEMLNKFKNDFKLNNNNMTFFVAHSSIDEKHSAEVKAIMEKVIKTDEDKKKIKEVANVTLYLTGKLLEESLNEYMRSKNKKK
jgi:hypothetical protein